MLHRDTKLAQLGNKKDPQTGAVSAPLHFSAAFEHPKLGETTGFDYTRTQNPTRQILEEGLADLEGGTHAVATSSGMSAIQLAFGFFNPKYKVLSSRDLYGGSYRYFDDLERKGIAEFVYFNTEEEYRELIDESIDVVYIESPTNPLMYEVDISELSRQAKEVGATVIVDNTLLPLRQKPLELGADIVVHSGTKYLTGHQDLLSGVVVTNDPEIGERLQWDANTTGPTLGAFDCWLFIRSLKTLPLRFDRQEATTREVVEALEKHPKIKKVLYCGQGALFSFFLEDEAQVGPFLDNIELFTYAESFGGPESLITYPTTQTHGDIPKELRESYGLTPNLLRASIGFEDPADLINDLNQALDRL